MNENQHMINILSTGISSVLVLSVTLFVIIKNWKSRLNRYLAIYFLLGFGILSSMSVTYIFHDSVVSLYANRFTAAFTLVFTSSFYILSFIFSENEKKVPFFVFMLIISPALAAALAIVLTDFFVSAISFSGSELKREYGQIYIFYAGLALVYLVLATINFARTYIRAKNRVIKLQLRYGFLWSAVAVFLGLTTSVFIPVFTGNSTFYAVGPSVAGFLISVGLFYSINNYSLMDITTAYSRVALVSAVVMTFFVPLIAILYIWEKRLIISGNIPFYIPEIVLIAIFIFIMEFLKPRFDMIFRRRNYSTLKYLNRFYQDLEKEKDYGEVLRKAVDMLYERFALTDSFFMMLNDKTRKYELYYLKGESAGSTGSLDRNSFVVRWFARNNSILRKGAIYQEDQVLGDISTELKSFFDTYSSYLLLPLYHEKRVFGFISAGKKASNAAFNADEIDIIDNFRSKINEIVSTTVKYQRAMKDEFTLRSVELSSKILKSSSPSALPNMSNIKFGAYLLPKYAEGTDYFDFLRPGTNGVGMIMTDISSSGIDCAVTAALLRSAYQASVADAHSTGSIMNRLNSVICGYSGSDVRPVEAMCLYYDQKSSRLVYTNAGYPSVEIFRIERNNFESLDTPGIPIGYNADAVFSAGRVTLARGDIGIVYSKSLVGSKNRKNDLFGLSRLRQIVSDNRNLRPHELAARIRENYESFIGVDPPGADVTAIIFKIV